MNTPVIVTGGRRRVDLGRLDPTCTAAWHGTYTAYRKAGCRCPHAREAHRLYQKRAREGRNEPCLVDATGSRRRIQGLWALGHPSQVIADECGGGFDRRQIQRVCTQRLITPHHRDMIAAAYSVLITRRGSSVRTQRRAALSGCALPVQWGADIDDPAAVPDPVEPDTLVGEHVDEVVVDRALAGDRVELTDAELLAAAQVGAARGMAPWLLAETLHMNVFGVRRLLAGELPPRRAKRAAREGRVAS